MIKPNSICMIRGIQAPHQQANGMIVCALELVESGTGERAWRFEPTITLEGQRYWLARERNLHPLDDFETELTREALDRALEHV